MNGPCPLCGDLGRVSGTRCRLCQPAPARRPPPQLVRGPRRFYWPLNLYQIGIAVRALTAIIAVAAMIGYATFVRPDRFQAILYTAAIACWALNPWPRRPSR